VSRIKVAVLAAASALASVVAIEVHGVAMGITAGCVALAAGAAAWSSSTRAEPPKKWSSSSRDNKKFGLHCSPMIIKKNSQLHIEAEAVLASS
jgi:hypothetical protein